MLTGCGVQGPASRVLRWYIRPRFHTPIRDEKAARRRAAGLHFRED